MIFKPQHSSKVVENFFQLSKSTHSLSAPIKQKTSLVFGNNNSIFLIKILREWLSLFLPSSNDLLALWPFRYVSKILLLFYSNLNYPFIRAFLRQTCSPSVFWISWHDTCWLHLETIIKHAEESMASWNWNSLLTTVTHLYSSNRCNTAIFFPAVRGIVMHLSWATVKSSLCVFCTPWKCTVFAVLSYYVRALIILVLPVAVTKFCDFLIWLSVLSLIKSYLLVQADLFSLLLSSSLAWSEECKLSLVVAISSNGVLTSKEICV